MPPVPPTTPTYRTPANQWREVDVFPEPGMVHVRHQIEEARDTGYMFGKNFWSVREAVNFAQSRRQLGLVANVLVQDGPEDWIYVEFDSPNNRSCPDQEAEERYYSARDDKRRTLPPEAPFQLRVADQLRHICDEVGDYSDLTERRDRFVEEALELGQSLDMTEDEAHQLVRYVFSRPQGEPHQEFGGAMTTLAGLAHFSRTDLMKCAETELERCWQPVIVEKIRGKRSRRHGRGPLPGTTQETSVGPSASENPRPIQAGMIEAGSGGALVLPHPLHGGAPYPAGVVLSDLAGQEGCDGEPYDTMQRLAVLLSEGRGNPGSLASSPTRETDSPPATAEDWLDQKIPIGVPFPGISFQKGVRLRTLISAARRWKTDADNALIERIEARSAQGSPAPDVLQALAETLRELSERESASLDLCQSREQMGLAQYHAGSAHAFSIAASHARLSIRAGWVAEPSPWPVAYQDTFDAMSRAVSPGGGISVRNFWGYLVERGYFAPPLGS